VPLCRRGLRGQRSYPAWSLPLVSIQDPGANLARPLIRRLEAPASREGYEMAPGAGIEPARGHVNSVLPFQLGYPGMKLVRREGVEPSIP
jgi:hypothetical protein